MSQAAKQLITIILVGLLITAVGVSVIATLDNKKISGEKSQLVKELDEYRSREKDQILKNTTLQSKFDAVEKEKNDLLAKINSAGGNLDEMAAKVANFTRERDELKNRLTTVQGERDQLVKKLADGMQSLSDGAVKSSQPGSGDVQVGSQLTKQDDTKIGSSDDEDYWAKILKAKSALQVDLEKIKDDLSKSQLEISDLKKKNSDFQFEISKLNSDKEMIAREIKYGNDLAKNLSLELARSQSEKQFMSDRMSKIADENGQLHEQLKMLTATKVALERSIVKLQGDKKQIEGKLFETEGVIQNRVEQIYELKDSLEKDFRPSVKNLKTGEIDLNPIIVSSTDKNTAEVKAPVSQVNGAIVSINDENNFVIVNLGEDAGIKIGEKLNVYRGASYIAGLEVIQVRKDILAADIKNKMMTIEVGDSVK
jgi:chromosome segregation ATPase